MDFSGLWKKVADAIETGQSSPFPASAGGAYAVIIGVTKIAYSFQSVARSAHTHSSHTKSQLNDGFDSGVVNCDRV